MKIVLAVGTISLLSCVLSGCSDSSESSVASIVGTWNCETKGDDSTSSMNMSDTKTFSADGQYASSKFPDGKKYHYRLEGDKLITSFPYGDWVEKVTSLTSDSLEYFNDKSGKPVKVSCKKSA